MIPSDEMPRKTIQEFILYALNQKGKTISAITNNNKTGDKLQLKHKNKKIWHNRADLISSVGKEIKLDHSLWGPNRKHNKFPNIVDQEISKLRKKKELIDWNSSKHFGIFRLVKLTDKIKKPKMTKSEGNTQDVHPYAESDRSEKNFKKIFLSIIMRSSKSNTYKFILAKSLLDYCENDIPKKSKYKIEYKYFAKKFLRCYWDQEYKFKLKQSRTNQVPKVIKVIREVFGDNPPANFKFLKKKDIEKAEEGILRDVFGSVISKKSIVIFAFQNILRGGNAKEIRIFYDYDNEKQEIYLDSKAFDFFHKNNKMLSQVVLAQWVKFLEKINHSSPRLVAKLERNGTAKGRLDGYREIFSKYCGQCFYCKKELEQNSTHVDHFIPWSYMYDNHAWNLVLSCQKCNCKKSNSLPEEKFLDSLIDRNSQHYDDIEKLRHSLDQLDVGRGWKPIIKNHYDNCSDYGFSLIPLP